MAQADFFSGTACKQLRAEFISADKDGSGDLDVGEFKPIAKDIICMIQVPACPPPAPACLAWLAGWLAARRLPCVPVCRPA